MVGRVSYELIYMGLVFIVVLYSYISVYIGELCCRQTHNLINDHSDLFDPMGLSMVHSLLFVMSLYLPLMPKKGGRGREGGPIRVLELIM